MWRAFFLAIGIYLLLAGMQCLGIDTATTVFRDPPPKTESVFEEPAKVGPKKTLSPPPWAPWSLMSTGAIVCLYSFTLPRRVKGD